MVRSVLRICARSAFLATALVMGFGVLATVAGAVEPLASRGGSRIGAIDPVLAMTGVLMMSIGLTMMGLNRMRLPRLASPTVPGRSLVHARQSPQASHAVQRPATPGVALLDALSATSEALDELAASLPRRRRDRISHASRRIAAAKSLLEAHNNRR